MLVEVAAGVLADSLALLSDAAHMLTDAGAIALALVAARLAAGPARGPFTFGLGPRGDPLRPAQRRPAARPRGDHRLGGGASAVGSARRRGRRGRRRRRGSARSSTWRPPGRCRGRSGARSTSRAPARTCSPTSTARWRRSRPGLAVLLGGFEAADGIAALVVALLMLRSGLGARVRGRARAARGRPARHRARARSARRWPPIPGVEEVHDLHVWEVTSGFPALSAHVLVPAGDDCHERRRELEALLHDRFDIAHTTLQVEHAHADELLQIRARAGTLTARRRWRPSIFARMPMLELVQDRPDWMSALGVALTLPPASRSGADRGRSVGGGGAGRPRRISDDLAWLRSGRGRAGGRTACASWARAPPSPRGRRTTEAIERLDRLRHRRILDAAGFLLHDEVVSAAASGRRVRPAARASARSRVSAARSRRETCICEQPMQLADLLLGQLLARSAGARSCWSRSGSVAISESARSATSICSKPSSSSPHEVADRRALLVADGRVERRAAPRAGGLARLEDLLER